MEVSLIVKLVISEGARVTTVIGILHATRTPQLVEDIYIVIRGPMLNGNPSRGFGLIHLQELLKHFHLQLQLKSRIPKCAKSTFTKTLDND